MGRTRIYAGQVLHEREMIFPRSSFVEEPLPSTVREKHHRVAEVDDGYPAPVGETPPASDARRHRYLAALGDQELRRGTHLNHSVTW